MESVGKVRGVGVGIGIGKGSVTVESPVCDWCNGHTVFERLAAICLDGLERREAAIAPAPDCDFLCIDVLLRGPGLAYSNLVMGLVVADVATGNAT